MNNRWLSAIYIPLAVVTLLAISVTMYYVFMVVPNERVMGAVQRIFYFHVGSALSCYLAFAVVFFASLLYLGTRSNLADIIAESSAEVGFMLATLVLASGMIWGHSAWNTWFRWEPRLISFLLLWLIFGGYNVLRVYGDKSRIRAHAAVVGIVGSITVPIVIYSIKLLPQVAQLHPQVVDKGGLKHPSFKYALLMATVSLALLTIQLIVLRVRIGIINEKQQA